MRLDDGDAWLLIKIVFWGILLLVGIRLALAFDADDIDSLGSNRRFAIAFRFRGRQYSRHGPRSH